VVKKTVAPTAQYTSPYRHAELVSASHPLKIEIIPSNASPLTSQVSLSPVSLSLYLFRALRGQKNLSPLQHTKPSYRHAELVSASHPLKPKSSLVSSLFVSSLFVSLSPVSLSLYLPHNGIRLKALSKTF
jgi:hypothetical protein